MNAGQKNINIINLLNEQHDINSQKKKNTQIPIEILDDLSSRFIINLPNEERDDIIRVLFQIELAHWFYMDFYLPDRPDLPKYNKLKSFAQLMFNHVPNLRQYLDKFEEVFDQWREYKHNVPTYGAVILDENMENVLMVQGFWSNSTWGFPKGKINAEEDPMVCACREVKEEIGFDCTTLIEEKEFIEMHIRETYIRLYIVAGVAKTEKFQPMTRNEIRKIQWFPIKDLPASKQEKELNPNAFFMVMPIIKTLKRWIYERRTQNSGYGQAFSSSLFSNRNQYSGSPVSKHTKENHSTKNHPTQQFANHANGNSFNRSKPEKLFNSDKITILKNPKNRKNSGGNRFGSETLMNFDLNLDALWNGCVKEYLKAAKV